MTSLAGFLSRKPVLSSSSSSPSPLLPSEQPQPPASLDLDEDLFSTLGSRLGGENEMVRNLLIEASYKIGELDEIKAVVGRLFEPVGKTLRAFEIEKADRLALQTALDATRADHGKLRDRCAALEKQAEAAAGECQQLRHELAAATRTVATLEAAKGQLTDELAGLRTQATGLEQRLSQEVAEARRLREDGQRLDERLTASDRRFSQLESELSGVRQKLAIAETEKRSLHTSLEKAITESARASRRLVEAENLLAASQSRLRQVEAQLTEMNNERNRLVAALDEANERHDSETAAQKTRFDAMASRAATAEKLLVETREQLTARADELRKLERQLSELTLAHDTLRNKLNATEIARGDGEAKLHEIEQARAVLHDRNVALTQTVQAKDLALNRADERIAALSDELAAMQAQMATMRQTQARELDDVKAALNREKIERAMAEGALETGRKDLARVMREVMALQRRHSAQEPQPVLMSANAA